MVTSTVPSSSELFSPLSFLHGPAMPNRFMLAPLTNLQSHPDGRLSDDEFHWLTMRAKGGFGATMTCAAHVQQCGQGFPGQLGVFSDEHVEGLTRLAASIKTHNSVALLQLHHAGIRSPKDLIGEAPVGPSDDADTGSRALSTGEVEALIEDFVLAAIRAERSGFDGVELHGAHSYIICAFLSPETNRRTDIYGGSPENRARLLHTMIAEIRKRCRPDFILGVRLSPERFGLDFAEMRDLAAKLLVDEHIDFLDMSLWDCLKTPAAEAFADRTLTEHFAQLPRNNVRLGVAGKLYSAEAVHKVMEMGVDFLLLGRAAILHHDFPERMRADENFAMREFPVTRDYLRSEGLSESFLTYMATWPNFIAD
jgi:2,4-dienoyl-CoA reductase-like NADH-dependent reductase (Old Yellow Enzyme family)